MIDSRKLARRAKRHRAEREALARRQASRSTLKWDAHGCSFDVPGYAVRAWSDGGWDAWEFHPATSPEGVDYLSWIDGGTEMSIDAARLRAEAVARKVRVFFCLDEG